jgi:hypothetical protein
VVCNPGADRKESISLAVQAEEQYWEA